LLTENKRRNNIKLCGGRVTEKRIFKKPKILLALKPKRRDIVITGPEICQEKWHWN